MDPLLRRNQIWFLKEVTPWGLPQLREILFLQLEILQLENYLLDCILWLLL